MKNAIALDTFLHPSDKQHEVNDHVDDVVNAIHLVMTKVEAITKRLLSQIIMLIQLE